MSFAEFHDTVQFGDTVIFYLGIESMIPVIMEPKQVFRCRLGEFKHEDIVGQKFGTKVYTRKGAYTTILYPTPELWTYCLPHRTQIIYTPDISMIAMYLDLKPGSVVVEAGTGSGSLSHAMARTIGPTGQLYTFDFHAQRAETARKEFREHGLADIITITHRDVIGQGFGLNGVADAVFLDLPAPWEAVESALQALKPTGGRICSFSPCLEQVQRTCDKLRKLGFTDLYTCESLIRTYSVKEQQLPLLDFVEPEKAGEAPVSKTVDESEEEDTSLKRTPAEGDEKSDAEAPSTDAKPKKGPKGPTKKHQGVVNAWTARSYEEMNGHTGFLTFAQYWGAAKVKEVVSDTEMKEEVANE
eukprot:comp17574_c0_seq2/m.17193 comp17574_c0_seq2/g.17193  ORF comp17574_c0_seq2/g.17193 comp17574_c0_seq2/m.17193 type:complete len:357 (-) comp17574_c0_seq2:85-1155(-)